MPCRATFLDRSCRNEMVEDAHCRLHSTSTSGHGNEFQITTKFEIVDSLNGSWYIARVPFIVEDRIHVQRFHGVLDAWPVRTALRVPRKEFFSMTTLLQLSAVLILGAALVLLAIPGPNTSTGATLQSGELGSAPLALIAADLGVVPEALVIAGITSANEINAIFQSLDEATELRQAYIDARLAIDEAAETMSALSAFLRMNPQDSELIAQYESAAAAKLNAEQSFASTREALESAAFDGFSGQAITAIQTWRASAHRRVPPEFRVLQRTDEQWKAIEAAVRAQQRSAQFGTSLHPDHADLLVDIAAETAVIDAANNLATYLSFVQSAVQQELTE